MKELTTLDCILTYSLNCLALFAFTNIIGINFFRADFSFWFFPSSNPDDNLAGEGEKEAIKLLVQKEKKRQLSY